MSSNQPNPTLYINNLNDKIQKEELRTQLYALFTTYGKLLDVVATKTPKMRGQAFCVFSDLAGATAAMRACEGMLFYDKPLHIDYAKSKSYATSLREDPNFIPPASIHAPSQDLATTTGTRRQREEDGADGAPPSKKGRAGDDSDDDEMEMDED